MAEWIAKRIMDAKRRDGTSKAKAKYKKYFGNSYFAEIKNLVDAELALHGCDDCIV